MKLKFVKAILFSVCLSFIVPGLQKASAQDILVGQCISDSISSLTMDLPLRQTLDTSSVNNINKLDFWMSGTPSNTARVKLLKDSQEVTSALVTITQIEAKQYTWSFDPVSVSAGSTYQLYFIEEDATNPTYGHPTLILVSNSNCNYNGNLYRGSDLVSSKAKFMLYSYVTDPARPTATPTPSIAQTNNSSSNADSQTNNTSSSSTDQQDNSSSDSTSRTKAKSSTTASIVSSANDIAAPEKLAINFQDSEGIGLTWQKSGTSDISGYKIYRREGTGDFALIGTVDANTQTFTDRTGQISTKYSYIVKAYRGNAESAASNEISTNTNQAAPYASSGATKSNLGLILALIAIVIIGAGTYGFIIYKRKKLKNTPIS